MNRYVGLVDSHLHLLSLQQKGLDPLDCLRELFDEGGRWALDVAVNTVGWVQRRKWAEAHDRLWLTAGVHPSEASEFSETVWEELTAQVQDARCVAVGEIGLDWFRGRTHESEQRELFRRQLALAQNRNLPIVIHNRQADRELLEDLDNVAWSGRGVQHCFSSDLAFARAALDRGFWISFAGNVTYKNAQSLREVAAWVPTERLLVETDSPYLAPQPLRGQTNRPAWAGVTASVLAEVRGTSLEEILLTTARNFETLFLQGRIQNTITGRG